VSYALMEQANAHFHDLLSDLVPAPGGVPRLPPTFHIPAFAMALEREGCTEFEIGCLHESIPLIAPPLRRSTTTMRTEWNAVVHTVRPLVDDLARAARWVVFFGRSERRIRAGARGAWCGGPVVGFGGWV